MSQGDARPSSTDRPVARTQLDESVVSCLAKLVRDFGSTLELDELLAHVAAGVRDHVDFDTLAVLLLDDLGRELHFRFAEGYADDVVGNWRFGLGQGIVGDVALRQRAVRVDDVSDDPRYIGACPGVRSELAVPLLVKGRTIGVLDVGSRAPGRFSDDDEQLLTFLAGHLANGIENARLYTSVRDQARTLSLLHESSRELTSILDRDELLRTVARLVKRLIDYDLFSVLLWNEPAQLLEHAFALGFDSGFCRKGGFPLGHGVTGTAAALRQPLRVPNVHLNPHYTDCGHDLAVRSELAVPLVFKDRLIGVLDLESTSYNAFTPSHEQTLATLGSYIAVALENARLYSKIAVGEQRLARDLDTAREIQKGLLPDEVPQLQGIDLGYAYLPARQLGGDFYDFLPYGTHRMAFAVGDVAGKGTPAALYASLAVGILRGHVVEHPCEPAEMFRGLNEQLGRHRIDNRFVAMAFGIYDAETRGLLLANAGFPRPMLVRDGRVEDVAVEGVPLGLLPDVEYTQVRLQLQPGDLLVVCSDGICESRGAKSEEFGVRRMKALLAQRAGDPAQKIAQELLRSAEHYVGDSEREPDDRTVVVLKVDPEGTAGPPAV